MSLMGGMHLCTQKLRLAWTHKWQEPLCSSCHSCVQAKQSLQVNVCIALISHTV